jgi:hypothetical protein
MEYSPVSSQDTLKYKANFCGTGKSSVSFPYIFSVLVWGLWGIGSTLLSVQGRESASK